VGFSHIILTAILTLSDESRIFYFGRQKKAECKFKTRLFGGNVVRFFVRIANAFEPEGEAMGNYAAAVTCASLKASGKASGFRAHKKYVGLTRNLNCANSKTATRVAILRKCRRSFSFVFAKS
jgi:hypothetical protein